MEKTKLENQVRPSSFFFYPNDYFGGTLHFTLEEHGAYMLLLILQFKSKSGTISLKEIKSTLNWKFSKLWPTLSEKFSTDGEVFWNERMRKEIQKRINYSNSRSENGKKQGHSSDNNTHNRYYQRFLRSNYWQKVRKLAMERDGNRCVNCGSISRLQVHHMSYVHHLEEHLNLDDLKTLCGSCHRKEHANHKLNKQTNGY